MYTLLVLTALAQPGAPPAEAAPSGTPPEQVLATIDAKGKLTIIHVACNCYGPAVQENTVEVPGKKDEKPTKVKVKISSVTMTTAELPAKAVQAYTVDGSQIEPEKLAKLLAKERTVLVATDGKKVDPALLQLYKGDTIVLVPPANALNLGGGQYAVPGVAVQPEAIPVPLPPMPRDEKPPVPPSDKPKP